MLSKKVLEALNLQLNHEFFSSYLYLSMASWFEAQNLTGFSNWMNIQNQEEMFHVRKIFKYIHERGGSVKLLEIKKPQSSWKSPLDCFSFALAHEQEISKEINRLVDLAISESDHPSNNFLQWFVAEQVEEEASTDRVVQHLKIIKSDPGALFMLDRELAQRKLIKTESANPTAN